MKKPLLTIYLVTYNHEAYIEKCLNSILEQVVNFEYKVIVLDDASTDGTSKIVLRYSKLYPDKIFPIIRQINLGAVENIYQGLVNVDTEFFAVIDGDDYWCDTGKLRKQIDALMQHPNIHMCAHNTIIRTPPSSADFLRFSFPDKKEGALLTFDCQNMPMPHPSSRVYRVTYDFKKVRNHVVIASDFCLFWYYGLQTKKLLFINSAMSVYNRHGKGIWSGATIKQRKYRKLSKIKILNEELGFRYWLFSFKRFYKTLPKKYRLLFHIMFMLNRSASYKFFVNIYRLKLWIFDLPPKN